MQILPVDLTPREGVSDIPSAQGTASFVAINCDEKMTQNALDIWGKSKQEVKWCFLVEIQIYS